MEIETLIEGFKLYNSCKGLSPKTITWYDAFLRHFADFLRHHQHPTEVSQLTGSHLRAWLHHSQERGLSPYTVQGQARTLKTFFRFAHEESYLETNIASRLKVPRTPKRIIQTFSEEQLQQLLATAKSTRDKAMMHFCFMLPVIILVNPKTRTIVGAVIAGVSVNIGMWVERYLVIVPSLARPHLAYGLGTYTPSWVKWSIAAGCVAFFFLLHALFTKVFPVIAVWEIEEAQERSIPEAEERLKSYYPDHRRLSPTSKGGFRWERVE